MQGSGTGPQVNFPPGQQSALTLAGGLGNLYVVQATAVNDTGNAVVKAAWNGSGYTLTTVASAFAFPVAVAVDGAGNVYVADQNASTVYKETPSGSSYTQSVVDGTLSNVSAVAADGAGNVYVGYATGVAKETLSAGAYSSSGVYTGAGVTGVAVDGAGNVYVATNGSNPIVKETLSNGSYTSSSIGALSPSGVAVDGMGNVYGVSANAGTVWIERPSGNSYVEATIASGLNGPAGVSADGAGNVYYASAAAGTVWELDNADPPALSFATTNYGATSSDSPKIVNVANVGNTALELPVPAIGTNPSATAGFSIVSSGGSACPTVDAGAAHDGAIAAGAACELAVSFSPTLGGMNTGSLVLTDDALNAIAPNNATQTVNMSGSGLHGPAPIVWPNPAAVYYGAALSATQLNATSLAAGTFTYTPAAGTVLPAAIHTLSVNFTPTDTVTYIPTTATVSFTVARVTPTITWAAPAAIPFGSALGAAQLNATASVPGTFTYSPVAGTVLGVGGQTLSATFTPTDSVDYLTTSATTTVQVGKSSPAITLVSSSPSAFVATPVTFTATVAAQGAAATGNVSFYDGTTLLGGATLSNSSGALTVSSLTAGAHSITAVYAGDGNFATSTSAAMSEVIEDFTFAAASGGSTTATASLGGTATFSLAMTPPNGQTFPAPVTFAVVGLPPGATATFSPASIAAGAGATNVKMTVQLAASAKASQPSGLFGRGGAAVALGLMLFPFLARRRLGTKKGWMMAALGCALLLGSVTGCSGGKSTSASGGSGSGKNSGSVPQNYPLLVTATSGSLGHTITLTLTVE